VQQAYEVTRTLLARLQEIDLSLHSPQRSSQPAYTYDAWEISQSIGGALGSLSKIQRAALHWARWEELHQQLVAHTLGGIAHSRAHYCESVAAEPDCTPEDYGKNTVKVHFIGPLLPFDTLMMPMSLATRLEIATATSLAYKHTPYAPTPHVGRSLESPQQTQETQVREGGISRRRLRLGFMSFDFNDHPTAHLIEAVFQIITAAQREATDLTANTSTPAAGSIFAGVELIVFSYGRNDGSQYRKNLEQLAHKFVDIVEMSFEEGAAAIRAEEVDILLDLQIHTLGSRLEITSSGVAPTAVNYLVYPGTSGARFYDYLVADEVVVPAEHAQYYSEALLLLPPTYQVSSYEAYQIPTDRVKFASRAERGSWRR
jgi:predicted O-linked N-acetylglucosamine transferase (SPINDLY family)